MVELDAHGGQAARAAQPALLGSGGLQLLPGGGTLVGRRLCACLEPLFHLLHATVHRLLAQLHVQHIEDLSGNRLGEGRACAPLRQPPLQREKQAGQTGELILSYAQRALAHRARRAAAGQRSLELLVGALGPHRLKCDGRYGGR